MCVCVHCHDLEGYQTSKITIPCAKHARNTYIKRKSQMTNHDFQSHNLSSWSLEHTTHDIRQRSETFILYIECVRVLRVCVFGVCVYCGAIIIPIHNKCI